MADYQALIRFLLQPLLENLQALTLDAEITGGGSRVLVRIFLDPDDKGRLIGKGGRVLQAVRSVVQAAALNAGQAVRLEVYDPHPSRGSAEGVSGRDFHRDDQDAHHPMEHSHGHMGDNRDRHDSHRRDTRHDRPRRSPPPPIRRNP